MVGGIGWFLAAFKAGKVIEFDDGIDVLGRELVGLSDLSSSIVEVILACCFYRGHGRGIKQESNLGKVLHPDFVGIRNSMRNGRYRGRMRFQCG